MARTIVGSRRMCLASPVLRPALAFGRRLLPLELFLASIDPALDVTGAREITRRARLADDEERLPCVPVSCANAPDGREHGPALTLPGWTNRARRVEPLVTPPRLVGCCDILRSSRAGRRGTPSTATCASRSPTPHRFRWGVGARGRPDAKRRRSFLGSHKADVLSTSSTNALSLTGSGSGAEVAVPAVRAER